jgi:hypothetical protein
METETLAVKKRGTWKSYPIPSFADGKRITCNNTKHMFP